MLNKIVPCKEPCGWHVKKQPQNCMAGLCEYQKIFKNTYFEEHQETTASMSD